MRLSPFPLARQEPRLEAAKLRPKVWDGSSRRGRSHQTCFSALLSPGFSCHVDPNLINLPVRQPGIAPALCGSGLEARRSGYESAQDGCSPSSGNGTSHSSDRYTRAVPATGYQGWVVKPGTAMEPCYCTTGTYHPQSRRRYRCHMPSLANVTLALSIQGQLSLAS